MEDNMQTNGQVSENPETTSDISISPIVADEKTIGKVCPFCKTEIKDGDEVILCPACGIPHHKGCWEENKGCTTFGCKEQHYEAQGTNPTDVCPKCGATLGDGQMFCPKCGTPKGGVKSNVCGKCGAELQEGQEFCPKCGQKAGLIVDTNVNSAISQFNNNLNKTNEKKKKKSKVLPIVLAIVLLVVGVGGYFTYSIIQEKKAEEATAAMEASINEYKETATSLYSSVLISGSNMETIGNAIQSAWKKYINSSYGTYYNGTYIYSVDSAVSAAQDEQSSKISAVRSSDSSISSLYKSLLTIPDANNQELQEIKDAVKELYDAYQDMYDCVISPTGNYSSWTSDFSNTDSALSKAIGNLGDLVH